LDLFYNQLSGSIPSSIGKLTNLEGLSLNSNKLSGSIPSSIGNLVNLQGLNLSSNQLSGSIPSSLGNLVNLQAELSLDFNQLSGSIPSSLGNLVNLFYLALSYNKLSGVIPSSIGNLANVSALYLRDNQLSGSIPSSISNLANLSSLTLSNNKLSGNIPSFLGNLVNLTDLELSNNQLTGSIPSSLGHLVNLRLLYLDNNQLSGTLPSSLGNLVNLGFLNLSHNKLSGKIPASFANFSQFISIDFSYNHFTFDGMELIAKRYPNAIYSPQARIPVHQNGNALSVSAGGTLSHNTYKWFRCEKTGNTLVSTIKGDSVFHPSQSGIYHVKVTNSVATELTLQRHIIKYVAPTQFVESASASASENALQQYKLGMFVYPNPAKDILHVQTGGKAIVSLTDQAGKILLTQTIEGNGVMSVASLPAGLYYLKNTSTGTTQKVIIAK
jgi:hypothetical protein